MSTKLSKSQVVRTFDLAPKQHPGQANDVFIGQYHGKQVAIRHARKSEAEVDPFFWGIESLFSMRANHSYHYENMYRLLSVHSLIPVPTLITCYPYGDGSFHPVHEFIKGSAPHTFAEIATRGAVQFGVAMARLHSIKALGYGTYGTLREGRTFHQSAAYTMKNLLLRFSYDNETKHAAESYIQTLESLRAPESFAPIMLDLDPTQYFVESGRFTAIIDIDFISFGPLELELVALETLWPTELVQPFLHGYQSVRPFPNLSNVRGHYRALNRLLCVQGSLPYETWHDAPKSFDITQ